METRSTRTRTSFPISAISCSERISREDVIARFEEEVGNPDWVTSSDIVLIGKCARGLAREYRLDRGDAPEEFYKLCLDMELGLSIAATVRRSVGQLR